MFTTLTPIHIKIVCITLKFSKPIDIGLYVKKFCVFCGKVPEKKNKEHILPRWLIEYTGDPKRNISLGLNWASEKPDMRIFPFNHFTVPACTECNQNHSFLEGRTKVIVSKILKNDSVDKYEINILLDWFDKVRIGLWLAMHYLNKNYLGLNPHFHINTRISAYDRCLFIYRGTDYVDGINFPGVGMPTFQYMPSCFSLRIKDLVFFNSSSYCFLSRRLGFPYPKEMKLTENSSIRVDYYADARERIMLPIIQWPYNMECVEIYQPIYNHKLFQKGAEDFKEIFNNDYIKANSLDFEHGLGSIFIKFKGTSPKTVVDSSKLYIPQKYDVSHLMKIIGRQTIDFQIRFIDSVSLSDDMTKDSKRFIKKQYDMAKYIARKMMTLL